VENIITQAYLRSLLLPEDCKEYTPPAGALVTPGAREYLVSRGITLRETAPGAEGPRIMPVVPVERRGKNTYVDAETGASYELKPEYMTHLSGNRLVSKNHDRIRFRGIIDSLEADVMEAQTLAFSLGETWYCRRLGEVLACLRGILAAEVKESPLPELSIFGLSEEELHRQSHEVRDTFGMDHPVPDYTMGPLAVRLNTLRTRIREGELLAVRTFWIRDADGTPGGRCDREDIVLALNRLSSALYWLFCRYLSKQGQEDG
jgi:ethanolamine utilization cobalamin adenosyltransferase